MKGGRSSIVSGAVGGLVVALAFVIALASGLIEAETEDAAAPRAVPSVTVGEGDDGLAVSELYGQVADSIAFVEAVRESAPSLPFGDPGGGSEATGSGFLIDERGHVLTNAHVVDGASSVQVKLGDEEPTEAELVGTDVSTDVAVLRVEGAQAPPLELGESDGLDVGDAVVAIGNPFGLDRTVTTGIVSALQREITAPNGFTIRDVVQTDAAINPGNSGGPLLDRRGRVIGINSQIATDGGRGSVGIGFAVPVDTVREIADQLIDEGGVERAFMGLTGADLTPRVAEAAGIDAERGAIVAEVSAGGPADEAGIVGADLETGEPRDVIVALDGQPMESMADVIGFIDDSEPGAEVEVELVRDDERRTTTLTLGVRPPDDLTG